MSKLINRRAFLAGGALTSGALVIGTFSNRAFAQEKHLRAGLVGWSVVNTLDPAKASLVSDFSIIWAIFNTLVKFDENMKIIPDLAESWEAVDANTWRFHLRQGVKFHDGIEMTSKDVKFSLDRVMDDATGSPHKNKLADVEEVVARDKYTVEIRTKRPYVPLFTYLTNTRTGTQIVPKHIVTKVGNEEFGRHPVGTGAFRLDEWRAGESLHFSAHKDYFESGKPYLDSMTISLISEESSGVTAMLGGVLDITSGAPFAEVGQLEGSRKVNVLRQAGLNTRFIEINHKMPPFDDVHFRRACSMAVDREILLRAILFGEGVVAHGLVPASVAWAHTDRIPETMIFNAERAKTELAQSKYGAGTEATILTWGNGWWKRFADVFVAQCNSTLGTNMKVEVSESSAVYQRVKAGDYQGVSWGWLGLLDPDEYIGSIAGSTGWRNFRGYSNPQLDTLINAGLGEQDVAKRGEIYRKADAIVADDCPVITCFNSNVHNLVAPHVKGFVQLPYAAFGGQMVDVDIY